MGIALVSYDCTMHAIQSVRRDRAHPQWEGKRDGREGGGGGCRWRAPAVGGDFSAGVLVSPPPPRDTSETRPIVSSLRLLGQESKLIKNNKCLICHESRGERQRGEIRSSGWETPAGCRHAAYVSWAVKACCHWLELSVKWEQNAGNRARGSEHPRATLRITGHFEVHHLAVRGICRCLDVLGRCLNDTGSYCTDKFHFYFFLFSLCRCGLAGRIRPELLVGWNVRGFDHDERRISSDHLQHFRPLKDESHWTVFTCSGWTYATLGEVHMRKNVTCMLNFSQLHELVVVVTPRKANKSQSWCSLLLLLLVKMDWLTRL